LNAENEKIKKQLEEETTEFKKVLREMGGWKNMICQLGAVGADTVLNTVVPSLVLRYGISSIAASVTTAKSIAFASCMVATNVLDRIRPGQEREDPSDQFEEQGLFGRAQELRKVVGNLSRAFENDTTLDLMALKDQEILPSATSSVDIHQKKIEKSRESKTQKELLNVCKDIVKLIARMEKAYNTKDENIVKLREDLTKIEEKCTELGDAKTQAAHFQTPSPTMIKAAQQCTKLGNCNLSERFARDMQLKLELTKEQLRSTEKRAEELLEKKLEMTRELHKTLSDLSTFKETNATRDQVLEKIGKGLVAFGQLKKQWTDLLMFFDGLATLVNTSLGPRLQQFVDVAEAAEKRKVISDLTR